MHLTREIATCGVLSRTDVALRLYLVPMFFNKILTHKKLFAKMIFFEN